MAARIVFSSSESRAVLEIVGYQFQSADSFCDANWLEVGVQVDSADGTSWKTVDPALCTFELVDLASWLGDIQRGQCTVSECTFLEPCIEFEYLGGCDVLVRFQWELAAPGYEDVGYELVFSLSEEEFQTLIAEVEQAIFMFPVRGRSDR
ncbi:MAG: hypothetical protein Q4A92_10875 [Corynebacterium sp.]|nr:hypothetical protein [Corynebacterium sp.]